MREVAQQTQIAPSSCQNVFKEETPILVNGETLMMVVYTCVDKN
jgi:hypothetical protein